MKNILVTLSRFFNRPSIHIISGIIIILCGLSDIEEGMGEFGNSGNLGGDRIGLVFLGISTIVMRGSLTLFKFFENTTKGASGMAVSQSKVVQSMQRLSGNWLFELGGGVLLIICGILEFSENIFENSNTGNNHIIWFLGLLVIGVVKLLQILPETIEAIILLNHVNHQKGWSMKAIHTIGSKLRKPHVELSLALFLIVLGISEEILLPLLQDGYSFQLGMHHGIVVFGLTNLGKILPDLMASKMLFQDALTEVV